MEKFWHYFGQHQQQRHCVQRQQDVGSTNTRENPTIYYVDINEVQQQQRSIAAANVHQVADSVAQHATAKTASVDATQKQRKHRRQTEPTQQLTYDEDEAHQDYGNGTAHSATTPFPSSITAGVAASAYTSSNTNTSKSCRLNRIACASTALSTYCTNVAAYADAATLELKRKMPFNKKLLHVGSNLDSRSFFYLTLLVLIYCCVLIRASAAAAGVQNLQLHQEQQQQQQKQQQHKAETETVEAVTHTFIGENLPESSSEMVTAEIVANSTATSKIVHAISFASVPASANADISTNLTVNRRERSLRKRDAANVPDDEDDSNYRDDVFDEYDALIRNKSAKGKYIGAPCNDMKCEPTLLHVTCDKETLTCSCERNYPVQLGLTKGCDKPKKLGEQCFYDETCMYNDENSLCVQVRHNALCQCASGFHSVSYAKPTRRVFCTQDLKELTSDLPTLLGVSTGIAVLAGLICMVLHLFSKTKYPRHRNFGDANLPPPIMYSNETGIPLTVHSGRPSSRSSLRSSGSIGSYGNRRASASNIGNSAGGSKGILVSTSRTGSRRPSLASVHSTSSSVRSYSMMRFEKEAQQKEIRQEMKLRLARLQQQTNLTQNKPQIIIGDTLLHHSMSGGAMGALSRLTMATPSPLTPNSLDELLPVVEEMQEYTIKPDIVKPNPAGSVACATLSAIRNVATISAPISSAVSTTSSTAAIVAATSNGIAVSPQLSEAAAYIGPYSSSTEALD